MSAPELSPEKAYKVARDGTITVRATGQRIGMVRQRREEGWVGYLLGPDYPQDPWQQERVDPKGAGRRWSVARAVWNAWQQSNPPGGGD